PGPALQLLAAGAWGFRLARTAGRSSCWDLSGPSKKEAPWSLLAGDPCSSCPLLTASRFPSAQDLRSPEQKGAEWSGTKESSLLPSPWTTQGLAGPGRTSPTWGWLSLDQTSRLRNVRAAPQLDGYILFFCSEKETGIGFIDFNILEKIR
uniref:Uncharacterized protein n=1 Tax=Pelusios castaneus TaxID=367368 RepID=A0A8C8RX23_9SAUR